MARITFNLEDGTEIETELDTDVLTIGRHPESDVVLPSPSVSVHHATIKRRGDAYYVQDLGTTNGTRLNGVEVEEAKLEEGDKLKFGDVPAVVQLRDVPPPRKVEELPKPTVRGKKPGKVPSARPVRGTRSRPTYPESSGCAGFLAILVFLALAFVAGLFVRHYVEYKRFLLTDLATKFRDTFFGKDAEAPAKGGSKKE